ncbi:hypothetical protein Taro_028079 [Colocasia esculenta]|uniref:Uncharacterized protein n=1 Tax=Colocasia esculenta TaxID=4460 RepID=A0A843VPC5_COLES|nr:hypothetical protein [Colocasia esculenta]
MQTMTAPQRQPERDTQGCRIQNATLNTVAFTDNKPRVQRSLLSHLVSCCLLHMSSLQCLFEVGKLSKMQLLDIFCEAVDPMVCDVWASNNLSPSLVAGQQRCNGRTSHFAKGRLIEQAIQKVREFSPALLTSLLESWAKHIKEIDEIYNKVSELQLLLRSVDNEKTSRQQQSNLRRKLVTQCSLNLEEGASKVNEKAAILMKEMVRDLLKPIECAPFHEIFCFKHVGGLQSALIGDPRKTIHLDLIKSPSYIQCSCCHKGKGGLTSSMHDTSIM